MATTKAWVYHGMGWDNTTRSHPAIKWFETYGDAFDSDRGPQWDEWYTDDFVYLKSDGTEYTGGKKAFEETQANYGLFPQHMHVPYYFNVTDTDYGCDFSAEAYLFVNLPGQAPAGSHKVKDPVKGQEWDAKLSGAFRFELRKVGDGYQIQRANVFSDSAPAIGMLMARGVKLG